MDKSDLVKKYFFLLYPNADPRMPYRMFGIECDLGWVRLLDELFSCIDDRVQRRNLTDFKVLQVKEKFGTLRVYVSGADDEIHALISQFAELSATVCEKCGSPARTRTVGTHGLLKTLCDRCRRRETERLG